MQRVLGQRNIKNTSSCYGIKNFKTPKQQTIDKM